MKRALPFVIIVVVLVAAVGVAWYLKQSSVTPPAPAPAPAPTASSAKTPPQINELGAQPPHVRGLASAPVTIEEFADFQCPPCGALHPNLKLLETEFGPERLRVVFRQFPLVPAHAHALAAARASEAAGMQGKFWEMHDMIFENQKAWSDAFDSKTIFEGYATKLGLNIEMFRRDIGSEAVERRVFLDGKRAHALGVQGTPTVIMNGREVPFEALMQVDRLRVVINNELAAAGK
jgi:protein-disulfide isomerase